MGIITEKIDEFLFQIEEEFSKAGTSFNVLSEWYKRLKHIFMKARNQKYYHDLMECVVKYIELVVVNFSLLSHKKQITHSKNFFQKVEALIEHDHKAAFLKNVSEKIFEIVTEFDGYQGWAVIKELLKMYYNVIKDTSIELRSDAVDQLAKMWMYKLTDSISIHSDYDMQVLIIEVIILLYGKGNLNRQIGDLIPESQELSEHFIGIDPDNFDRDVRVFLNRLNQNPTSSVFSIVCDSVQLGDDYVCITPFNSMQGLWVDFNMNNCVISWYCGVGTFDVIEEDNSRAIELISILGENISRFHISVSPNDLITIKFELQHPPLNLQEKYKLMVKNCNKCSFTLKNSDGAQKLLTQVLPKVLKYTGRSSTDADIVEGKLSSAGDETLNISIPDTDILDRSILFWDRTINTSSCTFEAISVSSGSHHSKKSRPGDENLANAGRQSKRAASGRKSPSNVNFKKSRQAQALTVIFEEPTTQPGVRPNSQEADEVALVQNGSEAFYTAAEEIPATLEFDSVHIIDDDVISQTQEEQKENQYPMKPSGHGHKLGIPLKELNFYSEANVSGTESEEDIKVSASDLFSRTEQCTKPGAPVVPDVKLTSKEERAPRVSESVEVPILDECTRIQTSESIEECALDGRRRDMIVNLITSESEGSTVPQKNKKKSKKINSTKSAAPELSSDDENFVTQYKEPNRILGKVPGTVDTVKKPRQRKPSKTKIENINRDSEIIRLNYSASIEGTRNTVDRIASDTEGPSVIPNRHSKMLLPLESSGDDSIIALSSSAQPEKQNQRLHRVISCGAETVIAEKSLELGSSTKNECSFNKEVGEGTPKTSQEVGMLIEDVPSQLVISSDAQKVVEAKSNTTPQVANISLEKRKEKQRISLEKDTSGVDAFSGDEIPKPLTKLSSSRADSIIAGRSSLPLQKRKKQRSKKKRVPAETVIAEKSLKSGSIAKNESSFNKEVGGGTPRTSKEFGIVMEDVPSQLVIAQKVVGAKCNTTPQVANISLEKSKEKQGPLLQKDTSDVNAFSDDEMPKPLTKSSSRDDTIIAGMSSLPLQKRKKRRSKKKRVPAKKNKLTNRKMSSSSDSTIFARRKKTLRKLDSSQKSEALDIEMGSKTRRLKPQQDYIFEELAKLHGTSQQNEASQRSTHRTFLQDSVVEELGNNNAEIQQFEHETDFAESSVKSKTLVDELPELSQDLEEVPSKEVKRSHCDKEGDKLATDLDEPICAKIQDEKHEFAVEYSLEKSGIRKGRKREECQSTQQIKHAKKHTSDAKSHAGSKIVILSNVTLVKGRSSYQQESILGKSVHVETGVDNEDIILGTPLKSSSKMETRSKSKIYKTLKTIESVKYVESAKPACEDVDVNHEGVAGIRDDAETGTSDNHHHESLNVTITTESAVRKNMPKDQIFGQDIDKSELNASSHTATEKQIVDIQADKNEDSEQIDAGTENKEICGTQKVTAKHNVKGIKRSHVRLQHSNVDDILEVFTDEVNYHQESNIDVEHNSATQKSHISAKGKSVQSMANINAHKHANQSEILSTHRAEEANEENASKIRKNTEGAEPMDANKTRENSTTVKRIERDFDCRSEYTNTSSTISRKRTRKLLDESITWHNVPQLNENLERTRITERSVEKKIDVPKPAASSFKEKNWKNLTVNIHRQPQEDESPFISARNLFQDSKRKNNELQMRSAKKVRFENNMQSDKSRSVPRLGHSRESACFRVFGELLESERHKLFSDKSENESKRTRNRTYRKKERAPPKNTPRRPRKKLDTVMRAEKVYSPSGVSSKRRKTQEIDNGNITPVEFDVASSEIAPVRSLLDEEDNAFVHDHTHKEIDGYISEIIEAPEWVADAIQGGERKQLRSSDFQGKYLLMFFYPSDFGYTVAAPEELEELSAHIETFKSLNVEVVGCCTTDENVHMEFLARKPNIVVPLIADCKMKVSMAFRMYVTEWGHNFRAAIFIDPKGKIQWRFILHNDDCTVPVDILLGLVKKHVLMHPLNI
ncbi:unnamed protein product [Acanthoscelides obtectus]|uniref:thioredoxin-dependent peroxiredoxin n=1 Tax=Acanthoscelides obtectus TaxID=200917 RepID=A0A9P0K1M0_ACAOB|nr:unnamed protein product [Acanthoscelides obtectus]CAK1657064.1 Peroxiredoxin-4 [Acanthoscelides obtectus]